MVFNFLNPKPVVMPPIIEASDLSLLPQPVLVDVRWYLDGRSGREAYESGHLPGAIFIDLDGHLAAHGLDVGEGRHPLPSADDFARSMGEHGIGDDSIVVAYDDTGGMTAGRLVVMLRMLGRHAALLNGGLAAFTGDLETGPGYPHTLAQFTSTAWSQQRLATADDLGDDLVFRDIVALDARVPDRYSGAAASIDPRPGHIPGAANAPWLWALEQPGGRLRSIEALRRYYSALGVEEDTETIAYCGSGVSACLNVLALEHIGWRVPRLYCASWSGWSADPQRPAKLGIER